MTAAGRASRSAQLDTSQCVKSTRPASLGSSVRAWASGECLMSATRTLASRASASLTNARLMPCLMISTCQVSSLGMLGYVPEPPPVTTAILPLRGKFATVIFEMVDGCSTLSLRRNVAFAKAPEE